MELMFSLWVFAHGSFCPRPHLMVTSVGSVCWLISVTHFQFLCTITERRFDIHESFRISSSVLFLYLIYLIVTYTIGI